MDLTHHWNLPFTNSLGISFTNKSRSISSSSVCICLFLPLLIGLQIIWFTLLSGTYIGLLWICLNHFKRFSTKFTVMGVTPTRSRIYSHSKFYPFMYDHTFISTSSHFVIPFYVHVVHSQPNIHYHI